MSTFLDLGLKAPINKALTDLGYEKPTVIQEKAIPQINPAIVKEVFHLPSTLLLSIKKKAVAANMAAVTSQKEIPT